MSWRAGCSGRRVSAGSQRSCSAGFPVVGCVLGPEGADAWVAQGGAGVAMMMTGAARPAGGGDVLAGWARSLAGQAAGRSRGCLRFAFYGRVSTQDWQDPVTSRARQLQQAVMLAAGHGGDRGGVLRCGGEPDAAVDAAPAGRRPGGAAGRSGVGRDRGRGSTSGRSTAASTRRWRRCSSTTASGCGCRRWAAGSTGTPRTMSRHLTYMIDIALTEEFDLSRVVHL